MNPLPPDAAPALLSAVLDAPTFGRAVFTDPGPSASHGWRKVLVRTVLLKAGLRWQVSRFDAQKDITKNYGADEIGPVLEGLLALGFRNIRVETLTQVLQLTRTPAGAYRQTAKPVAEPQAAGPGTHDRKKNTVLDPSAPAPFLGLLGFLTPEGTLKPSKSAKFTQISEFLRILDETKSFPGRGQSFSVVDFGCGNAYLTFALYDRLVNGLGVRAEVTGVDLKDDLIRLHRERAASLGWSGLSFEAGSIENFRTGSPPDAIVALHACDTATDDALAQGLAWGSSLIVAAPCCHHNLQTQLARNPVPPAFAPVFRYGLTSERQADLLTDAFRALILRIKGYKTDIVQFVDPENSPKNLLIRAVKTPVPAPASFLEEYRAMKAFWGVTPYLETLLGPLG